MRPPGETAGSGPTLYVPPEAWSDLSSTRAVALLIGGYDGSGNYGDVAQLQAAVDLLAGLELDDLALLPVVDLRYLAAHRARAFPSSPGFDPRRVLVYAPPGDYVIEATGRAGLVPAALPPSVMSAATYLYGGGYLNHRWAQRALDMLDAAHDLASLAGVNQGPSVATGLQIEPSWATSLDAAKRGVFDRFALLGGRDDASAEAARLLTESDARVSNTGDDAVAVIADALDRETTTEPERRLNLQVCPEPWVTEAPDRLIEFSAGLVEGLAASLGGPMTVQPVIAYEDPRISEREPLERLVAAAKGRGAAERVEEPIVLHPDVLPEGLATLRRAALTVGTSYHVTLTSLLARVPAVLVRENDYYAQKARGLQDDFELAETWFPTPSADAARLARAVGEILGNPESARAMRAQLGVAAERVMARREDVERTVVDRLRSSMAAVDSGSKRAHVVPARDWESVIAAAAHAQERAARFEELAVQSGTELESVKKSVSWRLTAPLRALRRRRR